MRIICALIKAARFISALYLAIISCPLACANSNPASFKLGYNSHFAQGWPDRSWFLIADLPADIMRDSLYWSQVEREPGHFEFNARNSGHIRMACRRGIRPVVVVPMKNSIYDGGLTVHTQAGRQALARFVLAIADEFDGCIGGIELGNEINGAKAVDGPAASDVPLNHVEMLKAIWQAVKPRHPDFLIVGGAAHSVATGFLERMFSLGALDYMDAVAIHPYRSEAENLDWELGNLRAVMRRYGGEKPIWATEFGLEIKDRAESDRLSPAYMAKMVSIMAANGVKQASWYALLDEKWFPNMGLFQLDGWMKPAARSFGFLRGQVLKSGTALRLNENEPALYHFGFGDTFQVVWGARRSFSVSGSASYFDVLGNAIDKPAIISETPFFLKGRSKILLGPTTVVADSLSGYGRPPWGYFARQPNGSLLPLKVHNWTWTSDLIAPNNGDLKIGPRSLLPAGAKGNPTNVVVRLMVPEEGEFALSSCVASANPDSLEMTVRHNGDALLQIPLTTAVASHLRHVQLRAGDMIEWEFAPTGPRWPAYAQYRLRLFSEAKTPSCDLDNSQ